MTLDKITLKNVGIYGGKQEFALTPPSTQKPVTLIGALNGGGKTTLLDSMQLVLYGPNAKLSNRGRCPYLDYLRRMIHRRQPPREGASIELDFHRIVEGNLTRFRISRSWYENKKGEIEEVLEVYKDGDFNSLLSEQWHEFIEGYLPNGISHLFFFDGEQIAELADSKKASLLLKTAINSLLGMDLVERLRTDLVVLERRKKAQFHDDEDRSHLDRINKELTRLEKEKASAYQEKASVSSKLGQSESKLLKLRKQFRKDGGDLFKEAESIEEKKKDLESELALCEDEIRQVVAGPGPLLLVQDLLQEVEDQADRELDAKQNQRVHKILEDRDQKMLQKLKSDIEKSPFEKIVTLLQEDRKNRADLGNIADTWLEPDEALPEQIRSLRKIVFPELRKKAEGLIKKCSDLREEITRCEEKLAAVPDEDDIADLQRKINERSATVTEQRASAEILDEKIQQLEFQYSRSEKDRIQVYEKFVDQQIQDDDARRVLTHSPKVRGTLETFRSAVIRRHIKQIEKLILESLNQLLRKSSLVSSLTIHPETFEIELVGGNGEPFPFDRLSAGERQLLAISILWGLAKASGRPIPTIIDTPLGRLDSTHRSYLVERYFPSASHQVILLSTDEEIDHRYLKKLKPFIGRTYRLEFDDATDSNSSNEGYFPEYEAAS